MLNTRLDVSTRVLKRKPERLAPRRHNEGGRMRDRIYTPWALYVARASTASTKCKTSLMEIGHMQNTVWDFTGFLARIRLTRSNSTWTVASLVTIENEEATITVGRRFKHFALIN